MGTFKKHIGALAIDSSMLWTDRDASSTMDVPRFKSVAGKTSNKVNYNVTTANSQKYCRTMTSFRGLVPVATADAMADYSFTDYEITAVGSVTYTTNRTVTSDTVNNIYNTHLVYSINIQNTGSDDIVVKCIRFKNSVAGYFNSSWENGEVLFYSYYLESPLTIAAGDTESVSIDFYVSN